MWGDKNGLMNVKPQNWRINIFISRAPSLKSLVKVFRLFTVRLINHILKGMHRDINFCTDMPSEFWSKWKATLICLSVGQCYRMLQCNKCPQK